VASLLREDNRRKINKNLEPKPKIGPNNACGKPKFSSVMGA
jgi:DNA-binding transcriptional regulator of glucitol operon